jgi:hypothetical protein
MCKVHNKSGSDSDSSIRGKGSDTAETDERFKIIKEANRKVKLHDIINHYGIKLLRNPIRPSWSQNVTCPFPTHKGSKERTPSLGYCFESDHFYCMGCGKSGRAVEFISLVEGVSRASVAEKIMSQYGSRPSMEEYEEYKDDITPVLMDASRFLNEMVQIHKHDSIMMSRINKMIWWLDFYLMQKSETKSIRSEDLKYRVQRMKEILA